MRDEPEARSSEGSGVADVSPRFFVVLLVVVLSLAAGLRFYRLDAQSFWNDEGNSARIAERPLPLIVEGAAGDIHPPGYYLVLHAWHGLFGQSEFALRSLSVAAGVALVALTSLLGRHCFDETTGLVAAVLSALSPFAIYYSQEARMYALLGALSAASSTLAFRTLGQLSEEAPSERGLSRIFLPASYALVTAAGLYTHYAFLFVVLGQNAVFAVWWVGSAVRGRVDWPALASWGAGQLGAGILYLPWVPTALDAAGWSSAGTDYDLGLAVVDVVRVLAVGLTQSRGEATAAVVVAVGFLVVGVWPGAEARDSRGARTLPVRWTITGLLILLAVPLGLFFGFDLFKPAWLKFLIVLLPPFHVLVAHGVRNAAIWLSRIGGLSGLQREMVRIAVIAAILVALCALFLPSLTNLYFDPSYARDDYRQLARDLEDRRRPGDAIVLNAPNQWEVFTYYYPDRDVYPAPYRPGPESASSFLEPLIDQYERLFVLYWGDAESDPKKRIESWLAQHAYKAADEWYGDVRLATYGAAPLPPAPTVLADVRFGERITLKGFAISDGSFAPGDVVPVTIFWEAAAAVTESYKVSVQLLDGEGRLVSQMDTVPGDGLTPTTAWEPGSTVVDRCGVLVPREVAAGQYSLLVAMYDPGTGQRLSAEREGEVATDALVLGDIVVRAAN